MTRSAMRLVAGTRLSTAASAVVGRHREGRFQGCQRTGSSAVLFTTAQHCEQRQREYGLPGRLPRRGRQASSQRPWFPRAAQVAQQSDERAVLDTNLPAELVPQAGCQRRAGAAGRDADLECSPTQSSRNSEVAGIWVVSDVDPDAAAARFSGQRRIDGRIIGGADAEYGAVQVGGPDGPPLAHGARRQAGDFGRDHKHAGAGSQQSLNLASCDAAGAGHEAAAATQIECGQVVRRGGLRRGGALRCRYVWVF